MPAPRAGRRSGVLARAPATRAPPRPARSRSRAPSSRRRLDILVNNTGINPVFGLADGRRPGRGQQDLRDQRRRRARLRAAGVPGLDGRARRRRSSTSRPSAGCARTGVIAAYGAVQGGADPRSPRSWPGSSGRRSGSTRVAPAVVKTQFAAALYAAGRGAGRGGYPMKRLGGPGGRRALGRVPRLGRRRRGSPARRAGRRRILATGRSGRPGVSR